MAHKHPIYDTDKHFVIDPITKKISTESTKLLLAQHSHNSERFTFEIPKEIEGHDMSLCNLVEIHYLNIDATNKSTKYADIYKVEDLKVGTDDTDVVFGSWLISGNATQYVGNLNFAIRFACIADDGTVEYSWPTLVYSNITVGETILNTESVVSENSDIIAQFEARIAALEENGGGGGGTVKTVNGIEPDENGNVDIEIPEVDLSGYAKTEDIPTIPENIVQTVNGIEPDENGNVEITIPDYGGNVDQSGKTALDTFLDNVDVDYAYDENTGAYYTVIRVYKQKLDGTKQYPFVYAPNGADAGDKSTYDMTVGDGWLLAINSGIFNTGTKKPDGILIQDGSVIQNSPSATHSQCQPLTIDGSGNLSYAAYDADADELVSDGVISAVCGFMPIVVDYTAVDSSEWNGVSHYTDNAQRQIIGQWGNGDYAIITCEGRSYHNSDGWTIAEAQAVCIKHGLKFAYNLDGGGSTETMLGLKHINTIYERTTGRIVPTFIVFNGADSFGKSSESDTHTHSYTSSVTTAATCTTAGVRTYTCSCGESYTETIAATGHTYVDGVCTVCGAADPDYIPDATLTGISATYSGGDVPVGTELTELTGIEVLATYDDDSIVTVTNYSLSGTIAEGANIITVSYGGLTTTFTVTGVAKTYAVTNSLNNVTNSNAATIVEENASYTANLTVADGYELDTVTVTMGGTDVTSTVYANGVVNISAVTGDVVITALAMPGIDGYTALSYIETDTNAYILTNIAEPEVPYDIDYEVSISDAILTLYGGGHVFSSVNNYYPFVASDGSLKTLKQKLMGTETTTRYNFATDTWYTFQGRNNGTTYDSTVLDANGNALVTNSTTIGTTRTESNTFALFAYGGAPATGRYHFGGKLKYLKLSQSGTVQHYFVPVTDDATSTIGVLDRITGTFYSSASTTAFTGA